jgi:hypothetical protein
MLVRLSTRSLKSAIRRIELVTMGLALCAGLAPPDVGDPRLPIDPAWLLKEAPPGRWPLCAEDGNQSDTA